MSRIYLRNSEFFMPMTASTITSPLVQRVLCSVTDKAGLVDFIQNLRETNPKIEILATGGTFQELVQANIPCIAIKDYTGFPECFSGRVKTIHPLIEGGILYKRGENDKEAEKHGIKPIDLVICNLYNFEKAAKVDNASMNEIVESMDIGGPTLIRSSCKNFRSVTVVVDPYDYQDLAEEFQRNKGRFTHTTREQLAAKAMDITATYDMLIASIFKKHFG